MVTIIKVETNFLFEIKGLHKLWAFKSKVIIPINHILGAKLNTYKLNLLALRMPGTHLPGLITAGTYWADVGTIFYDVSNKAKAIEIDLKEEHYKKLIIEVEDVELALNILSYK